MGHFHFFSRHLQKFDIEFISYLSFMCICFSDKASLLAGSHRPNGKNYWVMLSIICSFHTNVLKIICSICKFYIFENIPDFWKKNHETTVKLSRFQIMSVLWKQLLKHVSSCASCAFFFISIDNDIIVVVFSPINSNTTFTSHAQYWYQYLYATSNWWYCTCCISYLLNVFSHWNSVLCSVSPKQSWWNHQIDSDSLCYLPFLFRFPNNCDITIFFKHLS